jgi:hypothetical protein
MCSCCCSVPCFSFLPSLSMPPGGTVLN